MSYASQVRSRTLHITTRNRAIRAETPEMQRCLLSLESLPTHHKRKKKLSNRLFWCVEQVEFCCEASLLERIVSSKKALSIWRICTYIQLRSLSPLVVPSTRDVRPTFVSATGTRSVIEQVKRTIPLFGIFPTTPGASETQSTHTHTHTIA